MFVNRNFLQDIPEKNQKIASGYGMEGSGKMENSYHSNILAPSISMPPSTN